MTAEAQLAHLRQLAPALPTEARLAIVGGPRAGYQAVAPESGFRVVPARPTLERDNLSFLSRAMVRQWALESWDVLAVADRSALEAYIATFADTGEEGLVRFGNFFVKRKYVASVVAQLEAA